MTDRQKKGVSRLITHAEKKISELTEEMQVLQDEDVSEWAGEIKTMSDEVKVHKYYMERLKKILE